jgi:hypothetical protein
MIKNIQEILLWLKENWVFAIKIFYLCPRRCAPREGEICCRVQLNATIWVMDELFGGGLCFKIFLCLLQPIFSAARSTLVKTPPP